LIICAVMGQAMDASEHQQRQPHLRLFEHAGRWDRDREGFCDIGQYAHDDKLSTANGEGAQREREKRKWHDCSQVCASVGAVKLA